jgi:hypothetical protein
VAEARRQNRESKEAKDRRLHENVRLALEAFYQSVPEDKEASARRLAAAMRELSRFRGLR